MKTNFFTKVKDKFNYIYSRKVAVGVNEDGTVKYLRKPFSKVWIVLFFILLFFGLSWIFIELPSRIRLDQFGEIFGAMFRPGTATKNWDGYFDYLWHTAVPAIGDTLEMVWVGTLLGTLISVPIFILSSRNITNCKWIYIPFRVIMDIIRSIPTYVLALLVVAFLGIGSTSGIMALVIFTMGMMFKLMYEYIDTLDMNAFEASLSLGATRFQSFKISLLPSCTPMLISNFIYTFEINVRSSVILAWANAGGVGQILKTSMEARFYDRVGAILIPLFVTVLVLQLISSYLRRKIS